MFKMAQSFVHLGGVAQDLSSQNGSAVHRRHSLHGQSVQIGGQMIDAVHRMSRGRDGVRMSNVGVRPIGLRVRHVRMRHIWMGRRRMGRGSGRGMGRWAGGRRFGSRGGTPGFQSRNARPGCHEKCRDAEAMAHSIPHVKQSSTISTILRTVRVNFERKFFPITQFFESPIGGSFDPLKS
jgi:hypothetical protein